MFFINYLVGIGIDKQERHRKLALVIGLICNLLILGTFKYAGFIAESLNYIGIPLPIPHIALPIGISFLYISKHFLSYRCLSQAG